MGPRSSLRRRCGTRRPTATVIVRNRVARPEPEVTVPADAKIVEGKGKTLIPGLIDCHTHTFAPISSSRRSIFGVTLELDMFTDQRSRPGCGRKKAGKAADRADLRSAGTLVTAPGGHGTEFGLKIPTITAPEQAQAFVDARIAEGSDYIKIVYDDGRSSARPGPHSAGRSSPP